MFPVETLPAHYVEERVAAEKARRLAEQQQEEAMRQQGQAQAQSQAQQQTISKTPTPASVAQALQAPTSRPGPSVLANIFQGFVRSRKYTSTPPSVASSCVPSRAQTPMVQTRTPEQEKSEAEALADKRDMGIVCYLSVLKEHQKTDHLVVYPAVMALNRFCKRSRRARAATDPSDACDGASTTEVYTGERCQSPRHEGTTTRCVYDYCFQHGATGVLTTIPPTACTGMKRLFGTYT